MQNELTKEEAWDDFYTWIRQRQEWREMTREEKIRTGIYEANAARHGRRDHSLGWERLRRMLNEYAPGRYEFHESVKIIKP